MALGAWHCWPASLMVAWAYIHCPQSWMVLLICMWCHCISSTCGASPFLHILLTPFKDLVFIYWLTFPSWPGDASKLSWSLYFHSSTAFFSWLLAHHSCLLAWFDDGWKLLVALGSPVLPVGSPVLPAPPSHPHATCGLSYTGCSPLTVAPSPALPHYGLPQGW